MTVKEQHQQAMRLAQRAILVRGQGAIDEALSLNQQAFKLEKGVALTFLDNVTDLLTRAVMFRSAATLALNCGFYDEARELVRQGLLGNPPEIIRIELEEISNKLHLIAPVLVEQKKQLILN